MPYLKKTVSCGGNIFVYKYFAFRYGKKILRGTNREKTPPCQKEVNRRIRADKNQWIFLANFKKGDFWVDFNYRQGTRPDDIETAAGHIREMRRKLARKLKRRGIELFYMQMTERGDYGGLHHHIIFRNNFDVGLLKDLWPYGKVIIDDVYSENLIRLAGYFTKGRKEENEKRYSRSRNLIIPEPKVEVMSRSSWTKEPKPKRGYEIYDLYNGYHEIIGYEYQRYIMRMIC